MKINKTIVLVILISLLAFTVASQIANTLQNKVSQINDKITLDERQTR